LLPSLQQGKINVSVRITGITGPASRGYGMISQPLYFSWAKSSIRILPDVSRSRI